MKVTRLVAFILFLVTPLSGFGQDKVNQNKKKGEELFLKSRPTENQNGGSCAAKTKDECPEIALLRDGEVQVLQAKAGILVAGEISKFHSGHLAALILVLNTRLNPIEVVPEKVFFIDDLGRPHLPIPDYLAKSDVAREHELPPFSPPPYARTYTITQVPVDSRVPILPPDPSQPQFTTFVPQVIENDNSRQIVGYEIGYLIAALINRHDAKSQLQWIDRNWLHHTNLEHKDFELGYLTFLSTQDLLTKRGLANSVKLVVFVEDQQFVFEYGPETAVR
jgi:hypothetical protein